MSRKQYSKELKLELVKKHLPIKEHKGLKAEISFSFYGAKKYTKISTHLLTVLTNSVIVLLEQEKAQHFQYANIGNAFHRIGGKPMNISKFTQKSVQAVQDLEKVAYQFGNQEIEEEHLLYALLEQEDSLILKLIEKMEIR